MIENNRDLISVIAEKLKTLSELLLPSTLGLTTDDIADNLTTNDAEKVLSAKQGKVLNDNMGGLKIFKLSGQQIHWDANAKTSTGYTINTITGGVVNSNNVVGVLTTTPGLPIVAFTNNAKTSVYFDRVGGIEASQDITSNVIFFHT